MDNSNPDLTPNLLLAKEITGWISTILLTLLYVPQVYKVFKKKDGRAMSKYFLIIMMFLTTDTIVYGVLLGEYPLIVANSIAIISCLLLILARILYRNQPISQEPPII